MAQAQSFGDTISNGIQDIAALLPLLGTEQCERHVGEALQIGYLYAAATPLSIFGSLGVVKTAFATFLAATTKPFYGGNWLHDAGFVTQASVASMVTLVPGTKRYGAELQLERLMKEQHIDDPWMISSIERFGWEEVKGTGAGLWGSIMSWNLHLVLTSALASIFSLAPYVYLAFHDQRNALAWIFPAFRSFGSFLCVVSVQLALQLRIHQITLDSLRLMKARHRHPLSIKKFIQEQDEVLESRLMTLALESSAQCTSIQEEDELLESRLETHLLQSSERRISDLEEGSTSETQQSHGEDIPAPRSVDLTLAILQVSLAVGMGMIVTGYVGCFNLVNETTAKNGPYVWFGVEAALSILRLAIWGSNPSWDDQVTGLTVRFTLLQQSGPASVDAEERDCLDVDIDSELISGAQSQLATGNIFPFITSPHHLSLPAEEPMSNHVGQDEEWRGSFVAHNVEDLLAAAAPHVGPLTRIEVDNASIYYAILAEPSCTGGLHKLLCATAVPHRANGRDSLSFLLRGGTNDDSTIHSRTRQLTGTHALEVAFVEGSADASTNFLDSKAIKLIIEYSNALLCRLVTPELHLSWSLQDLPQFYVVNLPPVSILDREYMRIGQMCDLKADYCLSRGNQMADVTNPNFSSSRGVHAFEEYALMFYSVILETYLCIMEHRFMRRAGLSNALSHQLGLQWIQKMEARLSAEKLATHKRHHDTGSPNSSLLQCYHETWDTLSSEMRSLRLLPANSPVLQHWESILSRAIQFRHTPPFSELFGLKPLAALSHLKTCLHTLFKSDESISGAYFDLIDHVRLSIARLHSITPPPRFSRMDPEGPESPEFSPPYTCINSPLMIGGSKDKFITQMHLVEILILQDAGRSWEGVFSILHSLPQLPSTLTTLVLRGLSITEQSSCELLSLLKKHPTIISVINNGCDNYVGKTFLEDVRNVIIRNRRRWRNHALRLRLPHYRVGLEPPQDSNGEGKQPRPPLYMPHGYEMCLWRDVRVVAMVYIPHHGKIIPIFSAKGLHIRGGGTFVATLFQWSRDDLGDQWEDKRARPSKCSEQVPLRFDAFPEVAPGYYQVHVHAKEACYQYLFKKLEIEIVPTHHFRFSLHSPTGQHRGSFTFSPPGTAPESPLKKLMMVLFPTTSEFSFYPVWVIVGEQEEQTLQDASCSFIPNEPGPDYSSKSVQPPPYQFEFSLRGPEGHRRDGSFDFLPETTDYELENFTMVLDPLNNKLWLRRRWLVSSFGYAVAEEGSEQAAFGLNETNVLFDSSLPREQEDHPQGSNKLPGEDATGYQGEEDSRFSVVPSPPDESVSP
ncbi:hypothetical protein PQX77_006187 [Marasmius sp. AFHP31]|nr:hypothetical protein PQX77_006187 [Marasmius sp. AFHP31]